MCAFTKSKKYGQPINFDRKQERPKDVKPCEHSDYDMSANEMVNQFVYMKFLYRKRLKRMVKRSKDARRFYCSNDCAYIFDISFLEAIIKAIKENKNDQLKKDGCMVLFHGLRDEYEAGEDCTMGRPTLIATAYAESIDGNFLQHLPIELKEEGEKEVSLYDAAEHPGDGTSIASKDFRKAIDNSLEEEAAVEEDLEAKGEKIKIPVDEEPIVLERLGWNSFQIKKTITKPDIDKWV